MPLQPFTSWLQDQQVKIPEPDRLLLLIKQAGSQGMGRAEIGSAIQMDRDFLDQFLDGLVRAGVLRVDLVNGIRTYRSAGAWTV